MEGIGCPVGLHTCKGVYVSQEVWGCSCIMEVDVCVQACVRMLVELHRAVGGVHGVYMSVHKCTRVLNGACAEVMQCKGCLNCSERDMQCAQVFGHMSQSQGPAG